MFGHYLADLHLIDDQSDVVADIIADMILESKRYLKWGWKRERVMRESIKFKEYMKGLEDGSK